MGRGGPARALSRLNDGQLPRKATKWPLADNIPLRSHRRLIIDIVED